MNKALLHKDVQDFISENYKADLANIIFQGSPFSGISVQELATQLHGKKKVEKKLPRWFKAQGIIFPPKLNLEQSSSEITASYKASLIDGDSLVDLTGGFGVDSYFFAEKFEKVVHCEINKDLSEIVKHNSEILGATNIQGFSGDGMEFLRNCPGNFDWLYLDPSRRDDAGGKLFHLSECAPNVPEHIGLLFNKSSHILIKTSPLLDLKAGISALKGVREIHIVAINNDVKELLWVMEKNASEAIKITSVNFKNDGAQIYSNFFGRNSVENYGPPLAYLYEPNAAIMKSGLFDAVGEDFGLKKLHQNSHLYTSEELKEFPGRRFEIQKIVPYNKKEIKKQIDFQKAHISTRNFPESVHDLRKQFKLKDGGDYYLFFTTIGKNEKVLLICKKLV